MNMPPKHTGLGKGLDALIPTGFEPAVTQIVQVTEGGGVLQAPIDSIVPNPRQPRMHFDQDALAELAESIKEHGIIQPLLVTKNDSGSGYTLVAGERRWQASKLAGLKEVPVIVRQMTDQQRLEIALIENIQRADLNPLEEANAFRQLSEEFKLSHEDIASRVGKSRVAVTNTLRLLKLPEDIQQALVDGKISEGHARALLSLNSPKAQAAALQTVITRELTVRQAEELVRKLGGQKPEAKSKQRTAPDILDLEERLRTSLGTKVALKAGKKGTGSVTLYYFSNEELDSLLSVLLKGDY
jgi:ParB family chromosome partitioning protein